MTKIYLFYRVGCRPYIELYQGDERIKSTLAEYDRMRVFHMSEGKVNRKYQGCVELLKMKV